MRLAISMATGTGKTRVMAMLIAWYAVNRGREHRAAADGLARNVGRIVVIAPGRTIARQLQMLVPTHRDNIYIADRLAPDHLLKRLNGISVHVLNFEKLQPRRGLGFAGLEGVTTKATALADADELAEELETSSRCDPHRMRAGPGAHVVDALLVLRDRSSRTAASASAKPRTGKRSLASVARPGTGGEVVVMNDEGHHCWERSDAANGPCLAPLSFGSGGHQVEDGRLERRTTHRILVPRTTSSSTRSPGSGSSRSAYARWERWRMQGLTSQGALKGNRSRHPRFAVAQAIDVTATPFFIDPRNTHRPVGEKLPQGEALFPWIVSARVPARRGHGDRSGYDPAASQGAGRCRGRRSRDPLRDVERRLL